MRRDRTGEPIDDDTPDTPPPPPAPATPPRHQSIARIRELLAKRHTHTDHLDDDPQDHA